MKRQSSLFAILMIAVFAAAFDAGAQTPIGAAAQSGQERRVGVQPSNRVSLTLRDAVMMALENNRDIEIERLNTQMNEFDLRAAKGVYDPSLSSSLFYDRRATPVAS